MILFSCDKCGKDIGLNEPYIAITHNKEVRNHDIAKQKDIVDVKDSLLINVLCGKCGNQHNANSLSEKFKMVKLGFLEIKPVQEKAKEKIIQNTSKS